MCPGVDSACKNEYQNTPGGKDLTTFMKNPEALTFRIPKGLVRPVAGKLYLYLLTYCITESIHPTSSIIQSDSFVLSLRTVAVRHRMPVSTGTSHGSRHFHWHYKRDIMYNVAYFPLVIFFISVMA
jgi:hypothetical protein